ncbi:MAG: hypothetical protein GHCLOJNM_03773 [bacterium]|nr:hypothetical protein [bacterium]
MRYWLNASSGEWGILRDGGASEVTLSRPISALAFPSSAKQNREHPNRDREGAVPKSKERESEVLVLEREVFLRLYAALERLAITPVYSPIRPYQPN